MQRDVVAKESQLFHANGRVVTIQVSRSLEGGQRAFLQCLQDACTLLGCTDTGQGLQDRFQGLALFG